MVAGGQGTVSSPWKSTGGHVFASFLFAAGRHRQRVRAQNPRNWQLSKLVYLM